MDIQQMIAPLLPIGEGEAVPPQAITSGERDASESKRERRRSKERGRERSRSRDDHGRKRSRSHTRHHHSHSRHHDDDREDDRDRKRERRRSRSRSHDRDRSREHRDRRDKDDKREREREREVPPPKPLERDRPTDLPDSDMMTPAEKEQARLRAQLERDMRTALLMNINLKATEEDVCEFFEKRKMKVLDVRMISDKDKRKHKGLGYVEFASQESVAMALTFSGQELKGSPVTITLTQAEKNRISEAQKLQAGTSSLAMGKVHVSNVNPELDETVLRKAFDRFGEIHHVTLHEDEKGTGKKYGVVIFVSADEAEKAARQMNEVTLGGMPLYCVAGDINVDTNEEGIAITSLPGLPGEVMVVPIKIGLRLPRVDDPSPCIVIRNVFDPQKDIPNGWTYDIEDDMEEACVKYGNVYHSYIDKKDYEGSFYIRMETAEQATDVKSALHKRWYNGRLIKVDYVSADDYTRKFPESLHPVF